MGTATLMFLAQPNLVAGCPTQTKSGLYLLWCRIGFRGHGGRVKDFRVNMFRVSLLLRAGELEGDGGEVRGGG